MNASPDPRDLSRARTLLYVIGAQKAGTTWLHHQYARHPRVHFARKEFHYWNARRSPYVNYRAVPVQPLLGMIRRLQGRLGTMLMRVNPRLGDGVLAWRMLLAQPEDHRNYCEGLLRRMPRGAEVVGDITPNYALLSAATLSEMAAMHRDTRFIFIMRDPVDRLWSGVRHRLRFWVRSRGVDPALAARWFARALDDPHDADLLASRYDLTLARIDAAGLSDKVLFLFYETLFTEETIDRINRFLGINWHQAALDTTVLRTATWPVVPDAAAMARAAEVLQPAYDAVEARFGAAVPARWRRPGGAPRQAGDSESSGGGTGRPSSGALPAARDDMSVG